MPRIMKLGDRGDDVRELQRLLTKEGWTVKDDGIFGSITAAAVYEYQSEYGLVPDRKVGPKTLASLRGEPPPSEPIVRLVDVSQWSGVPDYGVLRAKGYTGVVPRLGSGVDGVDKLAEKHIASARAAGMRVETGYVYLKSWEPGPAQALHSMNLAKRFDLALWLDVEPAKPYDSKTHSWPVATDAPSLYRPVAVACFDVLRASDVAWGVYGAMFLESLNLPAWVANRPLWAATYGGPVKIPRPWVAAAIHQYEGDVALAGAKVDLNKVLTPGGMTAVRKLMAL